jgi:hypothetical protein
LLFAEGFGGYAALFFGFGCESGELVTVSREGMEGRRRKRKAGGKETGYNKKTYKTNLPQQIQHQQLPLRLSPSSKSPTAKQDTLHPPTQQDRSFPLRNSSL